MMRIKDWNSSMRALAIVASFLFVTAAHAADADFRPAKTSEYGWVKPQQAGAGGLIRVQTVSPAKTVRVYRLWDSQGASVKPKRALEFGAFWGDFKPANEGAARNAWAVCREWNHMDMLTVCELPASTVVAKGPGQTARCDNGKVLRGGSQQIVISDAQKKLKNCTTHKSGF